MRLILFLLMAFVTYVHAVDFIIEGGRIVDGTGAPSYVADLAISDGKIIRIGRLNGMDAKRRIDAAGLVVAPGFVDMMGQSATPLLDDPSAALNMLTQGITTINAGEGASAAPLSESEAQKRGWRTMMEYFQVLELRGLPINVAQTVGHTQVRRLILGDGDRKPSSIELEAMRELVREAMEAGAIGVSTALIYPPAVYADREEISALVAVAGEYGGRYYTHMRNEGDQLLEALEEAMEIGRKGNTPVHIFHLKAAGRANWAKMDQAVAIIQEARARGEQVTADIYPYTHNGLSIRALIHPRHFALGRAALLERLDDAALRQTMRGEMEADDDSSWENWYKHIGRDWSKLIVGRANNLRFDGYNGQSLSFIAQTLGMDPWALFFDLVKTDAFVLPESMSDYNKRRLIGEDFVSFCTDVGPAGGASFASHPRGYGAFPRLLAHYVREGKASSLERVVAQASAYGANDILAFDRGRIAEGVAADVIVFDYGKLDEKATFAEPHAVAEGMRYVFVNGRIVLEDGKQTEERPGVVLRGPGYRDTERPSQVLTGQEVPELKEIDRVMTDFIDKHHLPGAALAITDHGRLVYARGFGYADLATREKATAESLYRIASISKPITASAIFTLIDRGMLSLDDSVFEILNHYKPVNDDNPIDQRLKDITLLHLLQHSGGWDREVSFDAMFQSVPFAEKLKLPPPAGQDAVIRNMLAQPLDFTPGERQAYSNFGYCLLGRVIAKVTGMRYDDYVRQYVLEPSGARTMIQGRSLLQYRQSGEVRYYSPFRGPSVFAENLGERVPYPYGGWYLEAMDSHGAWLASAVDLARFSVALEASSPRPLLSARSLEAMFARPSGSTALQSDGKEKVSCYAAGWGRRESESGPIFSHSGSLAGTSTLLRKRTDGRSWVVLFNARNGPYSSFFPTSLQPIVDEALDSVLNWPAHDLFDAFAKNMPN